MQNFMLMKFSCNDELQEFYYVKFFLASALRLPPFQKKYVREKIWRGQ